jgi:hypothetical protein
VSAQRELKNLDSRNVTALLIDCGHARTAEPKVATLQGSIRSRVVAIDQERAVCHVSRFFSGALRACFRMTTRKAPTLTEE